tara:strand:- start:9043 stop:9210 length:168 start_codon:yes stop_codon:yes gene_type:complete
VHTQLHIDCDARQWARFIVSDKNAKKMRLEEIDDCDDGLCVDHSSVFRWFVLSPF